MFDAIYCLSMERYPQRRKNAIRLLSQLTDLCPILFFSAIDAINYTKSEFNNQGFFPYPDWEIKNLKEDHRIDYDMFHEYNLQWVERFWNRPITRGEMGCMLSHYYIWVDAYKYGHQTILVFEDDFTFNINNLISGLQIYYDFRKTFDYDIFYLGGAPIIDGQHESDFVIKCEYIFQTHSYIVNWNWIETMIKSGCEKVIIPADEFFSVAIGKHPRYDLRSNIYNFKKKLLGYRLKNLVVGQLNQGGNTTEMVV